jgi:hypothetical protein
MRKKLRLFGALGLAAGCHAYDEGLLTAAGTGAPNTPAANMASHGSAADGGGAPRSAGTGGRIATGVEPPREFEQAGSGETDSPDDVTAGSGGTAANGGDEGGAQAPESDVGVSALNDAGPTDGEGSAATSGRESAGTGGVPGATASASAAGTGGAPPSPEAECSLRRGRVWTTNQHCYFPLDTAESWNVSRDRCANLGASLVTITSEQEQAFAGTLVGATARWIGFARFGRPDFTWVSGAAVAYTHWETGGTPASGDAAAIIRSDTLQWSEQVIAATHPALCERP